MKILLTSTVLCVFIVISNIQAQESKPGGPIGGIIVKGGKNPGGSFLLSLGGGISTPDNKTQTQSFIHSGFNLNAGLYAAMLTVDQGKVVVCGETSHFFTIGPNVSGTFSDFKGNFNAFSKYNITGISNPPTATKSRNCDASNFNLEAGLQANFSFNKVTISPVLNGAYFSFRQDAFEVTQTNQVNGKAYNFDLYRQNKVSAKGFAFIPKLRIAYFPARMGFYLESNYTIGPDVITEQSELKPLGTGNDRDGSYTLDQLISGKQLESARHTPFRNLSFNFGLNYAIAKSKGKASNRRVKEDLASTNTVNNPYYQDNQLSGDMPNKAKGENPLYEGNTSTVMNPMFEQAMIYTEDYTVTDAAILSYLNTDQLIIAKGNYKTDFSENPYGNVTMKLATPISAKGIQENGIKRTDAPPVNEKGIQENGIKRTNSPSQVSEKGIQENGIKRTNAPPVNEKGIQENGIRRTDAAPPVNEKGIQENGIKRRDAPPVNEKGIQENGIKRTNPPSQVSEKGIQENGIKRTLREPPTEDNITGPDVRQVFSGYRCDESCSTKGATCFTCKIGDSASLFYEFTINPVIESDMITAITLSTLSISQNGEKFTENWLSKKGYDSWKAASDKKAAKTINPLYEGSGNSGNNPLFEKSSLVKPGEPIGGIVVKGGIHPGGQLKFISNSNGEFSFNNLQTADFQFTIEAPEPNGEGGNAARPGTPIGGIIVKGGKNPGGQMYTVISNSEGLIILNNLPSGNYTFKITVPTKTENPLYKPTKVEHVSPLYKGK